MQVNKINNSQTFNGKLEQKIIRGHLKDDSTAIVRITFDKANLNIRNIEAFQYKKGECVGGKSDGKIPFLSDESIAKFFDDLQKNAKDGVNFFRELMVALMKR